MRSRSSFRVTALFALATALILARPALGQGRSGADSPGAQALAEGRRALERDDLAAAETYLQRAVRLDPSLNDAFWRLAALFYGKKQYAQAVALLRRAPDPSDLDVREQLGLALYKTATPAPEEAVRLLTEVTQKRPTAYAAQLQLGQHFLHTDPRRAAAALEQYLSHRPAAASGMDGQVQMLLGTAYAYDKSWRRARDQFEALLERTPNDHMVQLMLGASLTGQGDCDRAIVLYERLADEAQRQPSIHYNLGRCYLQKKRAADAERQAETYVRQVPGEARGHFLLCEARAALKKAARALPECQMASRLEPTNLAVAGRLGRLELELHEPTQAVADLERAVAVKRPEPDLLMALAQAYAAIGAPSDKLTKLAAELADRGADPKLLILAGKIYGLARSDERAAQVLRAALTAHPAEGEARLLLSQALNRLAGAALARGEVKSAQKALIEADQVSPKSVITNRNLGLVLLLEKRYGEAEAMFRRALGKQPSDATLHRLLGLTQWRRGQRALAQASYEKAAARLVATRGPELATIYAELGPLYVEMGKLDEAVRVLAVAVAEAGTGALRPVAARNLALAQLRRGLLRLSQKSAEPALADLSAAVRAPTGALTSRELAQAACAEGVAALAAGKLPESEAAWELALRTGGEKACQFPPPYDRLGLRFFVAYSQYRQEGGLERREAAVRLFAQLLPRVSGPTAEWLRALVRSGYERLAYARYQRGDTKRAREELTLAAKLGAKGESHAIEHNLAVLDLAAGKLHRAEATLVALGNHPCEARLNLGILRDRAGDSKAALELFKEAKTCGAKAPKLLEWIDVKERLLGGNP